MPWYYNGYYRRRRWRRRQPRFRRFGQTFRRRRYRRQRWVRRFYKPKKLKTLRIKEYQPKTIRKCKIKGLLCLFQTTQNRLSYNFDMYEQSWVPERLPGGGGFSIKNLSLRALYEEHQVGHNIFTSTNNFLPLMRYQGCTIKFYQSAQTDYVATYSNTWPLESNMQMYNTMQPSVHLLIKNKIIIPSKTTSKWKKPYKKKFIPPPTQMKNQWYFQKDMSKIPLFMLRTSAFSFDNYYVGSRQTSTNITIHTLNYQIIQNRKFNQNGPWYARQLGTQYYYIYATDEEHVTQDNIYQVKLKNIIALTNVKKNQTGQTYEDYQRTHGTNKWQEYLADPSARGNPFNIHYISGNMTTFTSTLLFTQLTGSQPEEKLEKFKTTNTFQVFNITEQLRYNPYRDLGKNNSAYFLSATDGSHGWDSPTDPNLRNDNLPLWLLLFGFSDYVKKTKILHNIDEQYLLTIQSQYTNPQRNIIIPISTSFWEGHSPYEEEFNPIDYDRWYPCFQMQQEAINDICLAGPGTPKIPKGYISEAKIKYCFHFKWGGEQPPMATITDPSEQIWYPVPNNNNPTNSLQNPETNPASILYSFDERRGQITKKAAERMQKDWEITDPSLLSTDYRFSEKAETQASPQDSTSEEEEEDLFQLLQHQRRKQQLLKQRILTTLQKLQKLE